jgi:hypothetical protein
MAGLVRERVMPNWFGPTQASTDLIFNATVGDVAHKVWAAVPIRDDIQEYGRDAVDAWAGAGINQQMLTMDGWDEDTKLGAA